MAICMHEITVDKIKELLKNNWYNMRNQKHVCSECGQNIFSWWWL
jgi:hypothetical protein